MVRSVACGRHEKGIPPPLVAPATAKFVGPEQALPAFLSCCKSAAVAVAPRFALRCLLVHVVDLGGIANQPNQVFQQTGVPETIEWPHNSPSSVTVLQTML
jgi:hypothetical protein